MTDWELNVKIGGLLGYQEIENIGGVWKYRNTKLEAEAGGRWTSPLPDFVNDPAMTVMLMERIIREYSHIVFETWPDGCRLSCHRLGGQPAAFIAETVSRCVAEAFAKAKGLL